MAELAKRQILAELCKLKNIEGAVPVKIWTAEANDPPGENAPVVFREPDLGPFRPQDPMAG